MADSVGPNNQGARGGTSSAGKKMPIKGTPMKIPAVKDTYKEPTFYPQPRMKA